MATVTNQSAESAGPTAWVLEPDAALQRLLALVLEPDVCGTVPCASPDELIAAIDATRTGLVMLDLGVPPATNLDLIAALKAKYDLPVLAMTGVGPELASQAVEYGADDFLTKPFDPRDLVERAQFLLNCAEPDESSAGFLAAGTATIDLRARCLTVNGQRVMLSKTEWCLLRALALQAGEPVLVSDLTRDAFEKGLKNSGDYLKLWIARIEGKLDTPPSAPRLRRIHDIAYALDFTRSVE
jgi:two-component system KDP operon response regulator KdpE